MRILAALTILTMTIALADGQARAQTYGPVPYGPWAYASVPNSYCLLFKFCDDEELADESQDCEPPGPACEAP
jgi:hypothetical protein